MAKKETYLTCPDACVFEGMTSISAIIKKFEERGDCQKINKILVDKEKIKSEIMTMPNYFAEYNTTVHFIPLEELKEKHSGLPHGGFVIRKRCKS